MNDSQYFIAKHKDEAIRMQSRSGGIFSALSSEWLTRSGVVYGCVLDENLRVRHIKADTEEDRDQMRGSKYVQSDLGNSFASIKRDLESDRWVLFSGMPCQVAGLRSFLGKDYPRLLCVDIVCHGVPSPKVFQDYLDYWRRKKGKEVVSVDFRNKKKYGWEKSIETIKFSDEEVDSTIFTELFYQHRVIRPSCYHCPYKSLDRVGDITIGDAWGIQQANPEMNDGKGTSLVMINTEKGNEAMEYVRNVCEFVPVPIEPYMQEPLVENYSVPKGRDVFWKKYARSSFGRIATRYTEVAFYRRIRRWLKSRLKR
ncbi:MAG: Coenzyme F420 hydrogenase/dehydrogenase, beta subunit C-terminal domain [Candidatus Enteromonas sp.]